MDDFDTFKASREKMDPSSRKMSEHQWKQAYAAYRNARERVSGGAKHSRGKSDSGQSSGKVKQRRRSKSQSAARGSHRPSSASELAMLRHTVREQSAYSDIRIIVNLLAWVAIVVVVLTGILTLFYYTSVPAILVSLLEATVQVIGIVVARMLVQVFIDIPDIALYRSQQESSLGLPAEVDFEQ